MPEDILPRPVTAVVKQERWRLPTWRAGDQPKPDDPVSREPEPEEKTGNNPFQPSSDGIAEKSGPLETEYGWPILPEPINPARNLTRRELIVQRVGFIAFVIALNVGLAAITIFSNTGLVTLIFILIFKTQDFIYSALSLACVTWQTICHRNRQPESVSRRWILSLLPAYAESDDQLLKAVCGLRDNMCEPHKQVVTIVLDGQPKNIAGHFSRVVADFERPYHSLKHTQGTLRVVAGFFQDLPVILIDKSQNSGKKDTLVLTHDLFNYPRDNMPTYTRLLREEIWTTILPVLTAGTDFRSFDMIFSTDADSVIHKGCIKKLADKLVRDDRAIAACGLVLVEFEPGYKWSFWNLFQLQQYAYGQFVRRWAEGFIGKVTCLPGCVTMIAVRKEMAGAIAKFARPVKENWVVHHQVQNLGTDRRLTYCMLSQSKKLRTLFIPSAVSETVAPQSFKHYLHQRRRWGSNAYFNNIYYTGGPKMFIITRAVAAFHLIRQTCIYYRVLNTALFIRALVNEFHIREILPLLVVGQFPTMWYLACLVMQRSLRIRAHKIIPGFLINKIVSPFMSPIIFAAVMTNLGNAVWGISGVTGSSATSVAETAEERTSSSSNNEGQSPPRQVRAEGPGEV